MALALSRHGAAYGKRSAKRPIEFRIIFAACFAVFLLAAVVERLLPWKWMAPRSQGVRHRSVFEQAREAAGTCTAYAFMG